MDWLQFVIQWLHVIGGITWFGTVIYTDLILIPSLQTLPLDQQRSAGEAIGRRGIQIIIPVAIAVIVLGILRGTVFGPIKSVDVLIGTAYGWTWLTALVLAIVAFYWGLRVLGGAVERLNSFPLEQVTLADGSSNPAFVAIVDDIKRKAGLEFLLFLAIFTTMILMRFGL